MADLMAEMSDQRAIGLAQILPDLLSPGVVGFLDIRVIRPLAWPVITAGPPGGERRRSKATPCSGSSSILDLTGRPKASSCETRRRLAFSIAHR
jgi:hypothetical protein